MIQMDKIKHFAVNFIGMLVWFGIGTFFKTDQWAVIAFSAIIMIIISIGKEVIDIKTTGFSVPDLIADGLGILAAILVITNL